MTHAVATETIAGVNAFLVTLTQPRQSPGSGDGLSPGWRQAWAHRESSHGRQGTSPQAEPPAQALGESLAAPGLRRSAQWRDVILRTTPGRSSALSWHAGVRPLVSAGLEEIGREC